MRYKVLVKLYRLDDVDESLALLPMAARRALDLAGIRLSLKCWETLPIRQRRALTELGGEELVAAAAVRALLQGVETKTLSPAFRPPHATRTPPDVSAAFGEQRPIPDATWAALSTLDRYTLFKVAIKGRTSRLDAAYSELVGDSALSTHLAPGGGVRMVDVGAKSVTERTAVAETAVVMNQEAWSKLQANNPKGDVLGTARIAAIMAAKRTPEIIPLCHSIALTKIAVDHELHSGERRVALRVTVVARDRTGVEMEALTAASAAALTVYDMLKAFDKAMVIGPTQLVSKSGGRSGDYARS